MIPVWKKDHDEFNKYVLFNQDENIGTTIFMEKNISDEEAGKRIARAYNDKIKWETIVKNVE